MGKLEHPTQESLGNELPRHKQEILLPSTKMCPSYGIKDIDNHVNKTTKYNNISTGKDQVEKDLQRGQKYLLKEVSCDIFSCYIRVYWFSWSQSLIYYGKREGFDPKIDVTREFRLHSLRCKKTFSQSYENYVRGF